MRMTPLRLATLALAGLTFCSAATAADLRLAGKTTVRKLMGSQLEVSVSGSPNRAVTLFLDIGPGPTNILGFSFPLSFSPLSVSFTAGVTDANGNLKLTLKLPSSPAFHEVSLYFMAVIIEPGPPFLDISNGARLTLVDRNIELAGNSLGGYPHFDHVRAINEGSSVDLGIDPGQYPGVANRTADIYVVRSKTRNQWNSTSTLIDVAGGPQTFTFGGATSTVQANTIQLDAGNLAGPDATPSSGDTRIGVAYDVVIDLNQNGKFDSDVDLIDGYHAKHAGFYVVRDTSAGATLANPANGPLAVSQLLYTGGVWLTQNTFYPTNIASMGQLPLVVVSHGNGHDYQWYDHFGYHLASYGYIVMSHSNETGPGSGTAAASTIANTDFIIQWQGVIGGGALQGHIDTSNIVWIGHSRGADGVARAYDDLFTGSVTPANFSIGDIKLVDAIAPVDFGGFEGLAGVLNGTSASHPHDANFHLWVGQADSDVSGCASSASLQTYHLHDRATDIRQSTSLYGVGHGDFHNGFGTNAWAVGPNLIGRATTHLIVRGYILPLVKHYVEGDVPSRDFLWRQYDSFRPIGVPTMLGLEANLMFQDGPGSGKAVIDDFQDILTLGATPGVASSGAKVTRTMPVYAEGSLDDDDPATNIETFNHVAADTFNGFIMDDGGGTGPFRSESYGSVFSIGRDHSITYHVATSTPRFSDYTYLSFRAAQGTRHPLTVLLLNDFTFTVTLEDSAGVQSSINTGDIGAGIEQPYQRTGCGQEGAGWNSDFETIRIRIADFQNNGNGINLTEIAKLTFNFGPTWGSSAGRIGLDEIELTTQ